MLFLIKADMLNNTKCKYTYANILFQFYKLRTDNFMHVAKIEIIYLQKFAFNKEKRSIHSIYFLYNNWLIINI